MKIIRKEKILPMMVPWRKIPGTKNRYRETNPSIYVSDGGKFHGVVRLISYIKFPDGSFETWVYPLETLNVGVEGFLDRPDEWEYHVIETTYGDSKVYNTHWKGVEDIRFVTGQTLLGNVPELSPDGQPSLFLLTLTVEKNWGMMDFVALPRFADIEKNWMPFDGGKKFIYSVEPFRVYDVEKNELIDFPGIDGVSEYNGSSNGIEWGGNGWLFLIHCGHKNHRFLYLYKNMQRTRYSQPFAFFSPSHIEFVCSLSTYHGLLWIAVGVNDDSAFIVGVHPMDISWEDY